MNFSAGVASFAAVIGEGGLFRFTKPLLLEEIGKQNNKGKGCINCGKPGEGPYFHLFRTVLPVPRKLTPRQGHTSVSCLTVNFSWETGAPSG